MYKFKKNILMMYVDLIGKSKNLINNIEHCNNVMIQNIFNKEFPHHQTQNIFKYEYYKL